MGDVLHSLPLAANLHRAGLRVGWVVERAFAPLLIGNDNVDRLIVTDTKVIRRGFLRSSGIRWLRALRSELADFHPDVLLDPQANEKSFWVSLLAPAPRIVLNDTRYRRNFTRYFASVRVKPSTLVSHVIEQNLTLLGPIGVPVVETAPDARYLLRQLAESACAFLSRVPRPFALYHPGAGWASKSWGEDRFAELAEDVREQLGIHPVVSWGPGDEERAEILARRLGTDRIPAVGFPGLARIISAASFFIGGDTGPTHLADALGARTIGLYGPTDPARTGPYRGRRSAFLSARPCAQCRERNGQTEGCLHGITPAAVLASLRSIRGARSTFSMI